MYYTFIVRRAEKKDAAAVYAILQTAFQEYAEATGQHRLEALIETMEQVTGEIAEKPVYVAEINGDIVGTVRLEIHGDAAYLSRFAVAGNTRNIGIGKSLMNVVDNHLSSMSVKKVTLHTSSRHFALVRFYYGRGFFTEAIETDRGYLRARMVKEYTTAEKGQKTGETNQM